MIRIYVDCSERIPIPIRSDLAETVTAIKDVAKALVTSGVLLHVELFIQQHERDIAAEPYRLLDNIGCPVIKIARAELMIDALESDTPACPLVGDLG